MFHTIFPFTNIFCTCWYLLCIVRFVRARSHTTNVNPRKLKLKRRYPLRKRKPPQMFYSFTRITRTVCMRFLHQLTLYKASFCFSFLLFQKGHLFSICYIPNFVHAQFVRLPCAQSDKLVASYCSNLPSKYVKHQHITVTIRYLATIRTSYCKTAVLTFGRTRLFPRR